MPKYHPDPQRFFKSPLERRPQVKAVLKTEGIRFVEETVPNLLS